MKSINPLIEESAVKAIQIEWGEEKQIDAENMAFSLCISAGVFTQDEAEDACLKATTIEMMQWIEKRCENHLSK